jgi:beta-lactamase superfamily II metal-dependent hydrolase
MSAVIRYAMADGASFLWLGDLETDFMEEITDDIYLTKTTVVFAAHHGRKSGKIPDAWLEKLDPQLIVIGEAPSRHLHYYTGYQIITQNKAGNITFDLEDDKVHIYSSNPDYSHKKPPTAPYLARRYRPSGRAGSTPLVVAAAKCITLYESEHVALA